MTRMTGMMIMIASILNFGAVKFGIAKIGAAAIAEKSTIPHATAATYPAITAIRIGITDKNPRNRTEPKTAKPSVTRNTIRFFGSMVSSKSPALLAALEESSNPIRATTGPMAAGGRTTSIHLYPIL